MQTSSSQTSSLKLSTTWPAPPFSPLRTCEESVALWHEHVERALAWLRKHDDGVRAIPDVTTPSPSFPPSPPSPFSPPFPPHSSPPSSTLVWGVGVLIEPRDHVDAEFVLRNWAHFRARQGWGLAIVHGSSAASVAFYRDLTRDWPNVILINCGADDLRGQDYSTKLTSPEFWRPFLKFYRVVILQTDTAQISSAPLDRFCEFDWVGAPWSNTCLVCNAAILPLSDKNTGICCGHMIDHRALQALAPQLVGNGGLSLRNPQLMMQACERFCLHTANAYDPRERLDATNEDTFFCLALKAMSARIAPRSIAEEWSVEQMVPRLLSPETPPAGVHKPWAYLAPDVVRCVLSGAVYTDSKTGHTFCPTALTA